MNGSNSGTTKILNTEELIRTSNTVNSLGEEIDKQFKNLQDRVNSAVGTDTWSGERADAFKKCWDEFAECFNPVVAEILKISKKANDVALAAQSYSDNV